jgi:CDP-glycerol glycerophosphotransferase (TagB/SpsB family)
MYRLFGIDYFDSILLTGGYQANDIRKLETLRSLPQKKLVTVGCTYLDVASEKIKLIAKEAEHPFTVLISPSWGPQALLSRYGTKLLDPLVKTGWRIIVRPHPQSRKSENAVLEDIAKRYKDKVNLEWDFNSENIYSLAKSDIMISDFSGIIYDYMFLFDRPVMYVWQGFDIRPYDADDLGENAMEELWQFKTLKETGVELKEEHFDSIAEIIQKITGSGKAEADRLGAARLEAKKTAWAYQGEAGKRIAGFMMEIVNHA